MDILLVQKLLPATETVRWKDLLSRVAAMTSSMVMTEALA
jgi:hypothetical protein